MYLYHTHAKFVTSIMVLIIIINVPVRRERLNNVVILGAITEAVALSICEEILSGPEAVCMGFKQHYIVIL